MYARQPQRRVVITGMGALTSLGEDVATNWKGILLGRSGVNQIRQFESQYFPVRIGSEIDTEKLNCKALGELTSQISRSALFGLWAMEECWRDAKLDNSKLDRRRAGVCIGASTFPVVDETLKFANPRKLLEGELFNAENTKYYLELCRQRPDLLSQRDYGSISALLSARHDLQGASTTVQSACTSATHAIGEAFQMIRHGYADLMVAGGADSMMSMIIVTGFTLLGALSTRCDEPQRASRPFDMKRDGFVIGEGAGIVVLEELEHALERNAPIYAELIGYGASSDGYRFTDMPPDGMGAIRCMHAALRDAGIEREDVGYINAHGTSTWQNDRIETLAIKEVFGDYAYHVPVSSAKSQLGHLICAAGGIELIITVLAVKNGMLPPTINYEHPDPECDLDYVPNTPRPTDADVAISNSFGFGGQNGSLVIRKWDGS